MRSVQSLDIHNDKHIIISAFNVRGVGGSLHDLSPLSVFVGFTDVTSGNAAHTSSNVNMYSDINTKSWKIILSDLRDKIEVDTPFFLDTHKYVGIISSPLIQDIRIEEFVVDFHNLELTLATLPYEIEIGVGVARKKWYLDESHFGINNKVVMYRNLYKGGVGLSPATRFDEVTHEGMLVRGGV